MATMVYLTNIWTLSLVIGSLPPINLSPFISGKLLMIKDKVCMFVNYIVTVKCHTSMLYLHLQDRTSCIPQSVQEYIRFVSLPFPLICPPKGFICIYTCIVYVYVHTHVCYSYIPLRVGYNCYYTSPRWSRGRLLITMISYECSGI